MTDPEDDAPNASLSLIPLLGNKERSTAMHVAVEAILLRFSEGATRAEEHPGIAKLIRDLKESAPASVVDQEIRSLSHDGYLRGAIVAMAAALKRSPQSDLALRLAAELMDALDRELGIQLARAVLQLPDPQGHHATNLLLAQHFLDRNDYGSALRHFEAVLAADVEHQRALRGWSQSIKGLESQGLSSEHRSRGVALLDGLEALELAETVGLERYEIGRPLGRGRHAVVYEAYDRHVGRQVAIKRLLGEEARLDGVPARVVEARFFAEARTLAQVCSPYVVSLLDVQPRHRFVSLELCRGGNLRLALRRGLVDGRDLPRIAAQLRSALFAVHAVHAVHRDVKPANILVREKRSGSPIALADFGLAIDRASDLAQSQSSSSARPRARAGTLRYLAPEVRRGAPASSLSDIFSAGVVLLELALAPLPLPSDFDRVDGEFDAPSHVPSTLADPWRLTLIRLLSNSPEDRTW